MAKSERQNDDHELPVEVRRSTGEAHADSDADIPTLGAAHGDQVRQLSAAARGRWEELLSRLAQI